MTKKVEMKFYLQGTGKYQQMSTYEMVKDYIIQYVQKTYDYGQDIAKSLWHLKVIELDKEELKREMANMMIADDAKQGEIEKYRMEQSGLDIT